MKIYKGNVIDGNFDYSKYYPVSLDGLSILNIAIPNSCYMVEKSEIPEGKLLNGVLDGSLQLKDNPEYFTLRVKEAHEINTKKHLEFQATPFQFQVTRDDDSTITMTFDCSDNSTFNIQRAMETAIKLGNTPFYDGLGIGSDKRWSLTELSQVRDAVDSRLIPSFDTKVQNKLAINNAKSIEELETIISNIKY